MALLLRKYAYQCLQVQTQDNRLLRANVSVSLTFSGNSSHSGNTVIGFTVKMSHVSHCDSHCMLVQTVEEYATIALFYLPHSTVTLCSMLCVDCSYKSGLQGHVSYDAFSTIILRLFHSKMPSLAKTNT